jgi:hypothetical protein
MRSMFIAIILSATTGLQAAAGTLTTPSYSAPAQDGVPGYQPPPAVYQGPIIHPLIGIALPARNYNPNEYIRIPDPWDKYMVLKFNTFVTPQVSGPVELEVVKDNSGRIPIGSTFSGTTHRYGAQTVIMWHRLTYPNGQIAWQTAHITQREQQQEIGPVANMQ